RPCLRLTSLRGCTHCYPSSPGATCFPTRKGLVAVTALSGGTQLPTIGGRQRKRSPSANAPTGCTPLARISLRAVLCVVPLGFLVLSSYAVETRPFLPISESCSREGARVLKQRGTKE